MAWTRVAAHRRAVSGRYRPPAVSRCRGAVSHEAEGRGGARGGGVDRVGPQARASEVGHTIDGGPHDTLLPTPRPPAEPQAL